MGSKLAYKDVQDQDEQVVVDLNFVTARGPFLECIAYDGRELLVDTRSGNVSLVATGANRRAQKHPGEPKCRRLVDGQPLIGLEGEVDTS